MKKVELHIMTSGKSQIASFNTVDKPRETLDFRYEEGCFKYINAYDREFKIPWSRMKAYEYGWPEYKKFVSKESE